MKVFTVDEGRRVDGHGLRQRGRSRLTRIAGRRNEDRAERRRLEHDRRRTRRRRRAPELNEAESKIRRRWSRRRLNAATVRGQRPLRCSVVRARRLTSVGRPHLRPPTPTNCCRTRPVGRLGERGCAVRGPWWGIFSSPASGLPEAGRAAASVSLPVGSG